MAKIDSKVRLFRAKHEQDLRKIVTLGCAVSGCVNDGYPDTEEEQMIELVKAVINLTEKSRPQRRRFATSEADDRKVTPIRG